jgi:hypothetical protein
MPKVTKAVKDSRMLGFEWKDRSQETEDRRNYIADFGPPWRIATINRSVLC